MAGRAEQHVQGSGLPLNGQEQQVHADNLKFCS